MERRIWRRPLGRSQIAAWLSERRTRALRWKALLELLWRADARGTLAVGFLTVLLGVLPMGIVLATGMLVDAVPDAVRTGLSSPAGTRALVAVGLVAAGFASSSCIGAVADYLATSLDNRYALAVHGTVADATLGTARIADIERPEVAGQIAALEEVDLADGHLSTMRNLRAVIQARITGVAAAVVLVGLAWWAPLVLLAGRRILNAGVVRWVAHGAELGAAIGSTSLRRSRYLRSLAVEPGPAKEIRVFGLADWLVRRYADTWLATMTGLWSGRKSSMRQIVGPVAGLVAAFAAVLGYLGWEAFHGGVSTALVVVYVQAAMNTDGLGIIGDVQWATGRALLAARQVLDLRSRLAAAPTADTRGVSASSAATAATVSSATGTGAPVGVRLDDVRFTYRGQARPVLDGLDLTIPPGQSLAIVGENGAGKSTLIKLLCGLYEPDGGRITLDGKDPLAARNLVGVIFQDFVRYELSLRANVGFGDLALAADESAMEATLSAAGGADLLGQLPAGWETVLSRGYENGRDLSGGQWQKVALARALLAVRGGAGLLILDEPTAALDVRAETELFERFLVLTQAVTTILVSHRLASVRHADRIVVIADGVVAEDGSHQELLARGGRYARMFSLQAQRFAAANLVEQGGAADADEAVRTDA